MLWPGRPVLLGFPQDEGVRRNGGRVGAAGAPGEIRRWLYRLTPFDPARGTDLAALRLLDLGDVAVTADLEASQVALGEVVAHLLRAEVIPILLGGGHETAYGHYLGYVGAEKAVGIVNIDAHLDVRPLLEGAGHSGSPFRQALEHPTHPLPGPNYTCLGVQAHATSRAHVEYARGRGCRVSWVEEMRGDELERAVQQEIQRAGRDSLSLLLTLDADSVRSADVPGVSAPEPLGLDAVAVTRAVWRAGRSGTVSSFDIVEINPAYDLDGRSARWAARAVWSFLAGLAARGEPGA